MLYNIMFSFIINELPVEEKEILTPMIQTHGGTIVSSRDQASTSAVYRVMSTLLHHAYEDGTSCRIVSDTWVVSVICTLVAAW